MPAPDPSVTRIDGPWRHLDVHANGIRFHVVEALPDGRNYAAAAGHGAAAGDAAARFRIVLVVLASSAARADRGASGRRRPARLRRQRQATPRLRRLDARRRHGRTHSCARALVGDAGRPRRRRAGLLGHRAAAFTAGARHRADQLAAPGRVATIHVDAARSGLRTVADVAALPAADLAGAPADPRQRGGDRASGPQPQLLPNGLRPKIFPRRSAICGPAIRIPAAAHCALEYQRWAVRSQLRDEGRRFMRSMCQQLGLPLLHLRGDADPYVLADPVDRTQRYAPARTLRIHHRRRAFQPRRGTGGNQQAPDEVLRAGARAADQLTQAPVATCWVSPILES